MRILIAMLMLIVLSGCTAMMLGGGVPAETQSQAEDEEELKRKR